GCDAAGILMKGLAQLLHTQNRRAVRRRVARLFGCRTSVRVWPCRGPVQVVLQTAVLAPPNPDLRQSLLPIVHRLILAQRRPQQAATVIMLWAAEQFGRAVFFHNA